MQSDLLPAKTAAALLQLHPNTLAKWRISGFGPEYVKQGRAIRYRRAELERWLRDRTYRHTAEYLHDPAIPVPQP